MDLKNTKQSCCLFHSQNKQTKKKNMDFVNIKKINHKNEPEMSHGVEQSPEQLLKWSQIAVGAL